jgi:hypothetical protein
VQGKNTIKKGAGGTFSHLIKSDENAQTFGESKAITLLPDFSA